MKKQGIFDGVWLILITAFLLLGGISLLMLPTPRYSTRENRMLAEKPSFTWQALADGTYTTAWDTYAAERMTGRHVMRGVRAAAELAIGKCEVGGVMLCTDGSLTKRLTVNERIYRKNLNTVSKISAQATASGVPLTVAVVPRRMDARTDILPPLYQSNATAAPYRTLAEELPSAIIFESITADTAWFRTDHHWTAEGAYTAYTALASTLGYTPYPRTDFTVETVTESFLGTTDAAAGILGIKPDKIDLWRYAGDTAFQLTKDGAPTAFAGFYDLAKLETRDGYGVFLGGNAGMTEIDLGKDDTRPTLLLLKDSYANALIPFLARHYRILAVDPRYTTADINTLLSTADHALLLCGMQTLTETAAFDL